MKVKEAWRFRKRSGADPIIVSSCGCRVWCYTGQVVRFCKEHLPPVPTSEGEEANDERA